MASLHHLRFKHCRKKQKKLNVFDMDGKEFKVQDLLAANNWKMQFLTTNLTFVLKLVCFDFFWFLLFWFVLLCITLCAVHGMSEFSTTSSSALNVKLVTRMLLKMSMVLALVMSYAQSPSWRFWCSFPCWPTDTSHRRSTSDTGRVLSHIQSCRGRQPLLQCNSMRLHLV